MLHLPQPNLSPSVSNTTRLDVTIIFVIQFFMASVLLDLGLYGHDSLSGSLDCPQPGSGIWSSAFLSGIRPDTSEQVSISLGLSVPVQKNHHSFPQFKRGMDLLEWAQQVDDISGTRASHLREEAEKSGTVHSGKDKAQGDLIYVYK